MPRRAKVEKREVPPDAVYHSATVAKFINRIMQGGKKATAERIVYGALDIIGGRDKRNPMDTLEQAIRNATPLLKVKPRRVGGATYQVPVEVDRAQGVSLAMRWLVQSSRQRSGRSMSEKLASELLDAAQGQGVTVKRREDTHRMAEANRAFVHYRW
ncbi:MAG: 30S ribosomal protein S7 [Dehalococcoidia bacterium]